MRLQDLPASIRARFGRPSTWGAILVFGAVWVLARGLAGRPFGRLSPFGEFLVPVLLLAGHLALCSIPWQWTGDGRRMAPLWRGCLQALPWNAAWLLLCMLLLHGFFPEQPRVEQAPIAPSTQPPPEPASAERPPAPRQDERRPPHRPGEKPHPWDRPAPEDPASRPDPADDRPPHRPGEVPHPWDLPAEAGRQAPMEPRVPADRSKDTVLLAGHLPVQRQELLVFLLNLPFAMILGWFLAEKERAESSERELETQARQAKALALQAQLHPHALYNVLAGLTELVHEDPDAAEEALVGLVELLRMLTAHGSATCLPLAQERALVRRFLAIEAIRLGPRLTVSWEWPEWADALPLPPLLLQPLVENAIKHGIAPHPEGGALRIRVFRSDRDLVLQVANTGQPFAPDRAAGTGLGNLRERLALMPELNGSLDLREEAGWTLAEIRLGPTLKA